MKKLLAFAVNLFFVSVSLIYAADSASKKKGTLKQSPKSATIEAQVLKVTDSTGVIEVLHEGKKSSA